MNRKYNKNSPYISLSNQFLNVFSTWNHRKAKNFLNFKNQAEFYRIKWKPMTVCSLLNCPSQKSRKRIKKWLRRNKFWNPQIKSCWIRRNPFWDIGRFEGSLPAFGTNWFTAALITRCLSTNKEKLQTSQHKLGSMPNSIWAWNSQTFLSSLTVNFRWQKLWQYINISQKNGSLNYWVKMRNTVLK